MRPLEHVMLEHTRRFAPAAPEDVIAATSAARIVQADLLVAVGGGSVDHAVESYCSPLANPETEALSLQGLHFLSLALPRIKAEPDNLKARLDAQFGMWQAIGPVQEPVMESATSLERLSA